MTKAAQPTILVRWRVFRVKLPAYIAHRFYAAGYCDSVDDGWVSGAIKTYNADARTIVTTSGDKVQLSGASGGFSRDADRAWGAFCRKRRVTEIADVSSRYTLGESRKRRRAVHTDRTTGN